MMSDTNGNSIRHASRFAASVAVIPFQFDTHNVDVRLDDQGNPWWVLQDVCAVLSIKNVSDAAKRLEPQECTTIALSDKFHSELKLLLMNEPGLYRLIMRSSFVLGDERCCPLPVETGIGAVGGGGLGVAALSRWRAARGRPWAALWERRPGKGTRSLAGLGRAPASQAWESQAAPPQQLAAAQRWPGVVRPRWERPAGRALRCFAV